MRQAGQIEAISPAKGTLSNIGQKHRRRKAFLGSESKFVSYVKLLCKLVYVNRLGGRRRIALHGRKRARYGMRSIHRVPYLALTDDHDLYSPASSVFSPPVHFRDFHHGLFPPCGLPDRCAGVPALFPGPPAAQQPRLEHLRHDRVARAVFLVVKPERLGLVQPGCSAGACAGFIPLPSWRNSVSTICALFTP